MLVMSLIIPYIYDYSVTPEKYKLKYKLKHKLPWIHVMVTWLKADVELEWKLIAHYSAEFREGVK